VPMKKQKIPNLNKSLKSENIGDMLI